MPHYTLEVPAALGWLPLWAIGLGLLGAALAIALALHELLVRAVGRALRGRSEFTRSLVLRTRSPGRFSLVVLALAGATQVAPFSAYQATVMQHALLVAFIVLIGWVLLTALDIASALHSRRYRIDVADNLLARKHLTQTRILRQAAATLIILLTTGFALMTIPGVRQLGVSLLAAGGAAGIILGLALQPLLSNVMAGIQIALTQPIRIDDAVIVEGEWGNVEEITSTYVVIRIWDLRRLIVPLKYFLEKPFQNWTRESADLLGVVMLYVDYRVPVDAIRAKLKDVLDASPHWDRKVSVVQVTELKERTVEVRILASAASAGVAFDLRCEIREKLLTWLREAHPEALPVDRLELSPLDAGAPSASRARPAEQRVQ